MSCIAENNVMVGKSYRLNSSRGMNMLSFGRGFICSTITADQEKISIEMMPAKKNKIPVIYFEDITKVMVSRKLSVYHGIMILFSIILGIVNPLGFALAAAFLWLGINRKITVFLRNGNQAVLYSRNKKRCDEFVQDLRSVLGETGMR